MRTTWAAVVVALLIGLALGHMKAPVEAAQQKGVLTSLVGKKVHFSPEPGSLTATLIAFDEQWLVLDYGNYRTYTPISQIQYLMPGSSVK